MPPATRTPQTPPGTRPRRPLQADVMFVAGWGRSGSTLLTAVLGELPGCVAVGELHQLLHPGTLCGCGLPADECPFWLRVVATAEADLGGIDRERFLVAQRRLAATRRTPAILWRPLDPELAYVADVQAELYRAAAGSAGAHAVIDGSKDPASAALVVGDPRASLLHLVRDPRASTYSWTSHQRQGVHMLGAATATGRWVEWNAMAELCFHRQPGARRLRLRYEDFVAQPAPTLAALAALLGTSVPGDLLVDGAVHLGPNHMLGGNVTRFRHGEVPLVADMAWQERMPRSRRLLVSLATGPLMLHYGYR